jgi:hypothetical protein
MMARILSEPSESSSSLSHSFSEDSIAIAQQVAQELVKGKCFPQLLSRPLIEVRNATPVMGPYQVLGARFAPSTMYLLARTRCRCQV